MPNIKATVTNFEEEVGTRCRIRNGRWQRVAIYRSVFIAKNKI